MTTPGQPSRIGVHSLFRPGYRPAYRARTARRSGLRSACRVPARIRSAARFWSRPPNPAVLLCRTLKQLLDTPVPPGPQLATELKFHTKNGQKWTDFGVGTPSDLSTLNTHLSAKLKNHTENGQERTDFNDLSSTDPRLLQWGLFYHLLEVSAIAAEEVRKHPRRVTLQQVVKLYDLAFTLGRRACGLPLDSPQPQSEKPPAEDRYAKFLADVERIYGSGRSAYE